MFGNLFKKLGLGKGEATVADAVLTRVVDTATGGAASKVEAAGKAVIGEVKKRKKKR